MTRTMLLLFVVVSCFSLSTPKAYGGTAEGVQHEVPSSIANPLIDHHFELNRQAAIIKTEEDLISHLAAAKWTGSPLDAFNDKAKDRFIGDLSFGDGGVASFNSAVLENELTPTDSYAILALFGLQDAIAHMHHEKVETSLDEDLNRSCGGGGFWGPQSNEPNSAGVSAGCGSEYVKGKCDGAGTCRERQGYTCHPPSCR